MREIKILEIVLFGIFLVAISVPDSAASSRRRAVNMDMVNDMTPHAIADTNSTEQLYHVVAETNYRKEQDVGCRAQQERRLVPTLCFRPEMDSSLREVLVERCLSLLKNTMTIPNSNKWTDPRCIEATIQRKLDLEYSRY